MSRSSALSLARWFLPRGVSGVVLVALVFFGILLRGWNLGGGLLWHDELATRVFAAGYTVDEWKRDLYSGTVRELEEVLHYQRHNPERSVWRATRELATQDPQHPPLYYVAARAWVSSLGDGLGTLRALSALCGILSIAAVGWLSAELYRNRKAAWTSAALFSISPFFVLYAKEAREYAMWTLWTALSLASLLRALRISAESKGRTWPAWGVYVLLTTASLYTSFSTVSVLLAQCLYVAVRERLRATKAARSAALAMVSSGVLFLPWAAQLVAHYDAFQETMRWSREIVIPRSALLRILGHNMSRTLLDFAPELVSPMLWTAMFLAVAVVIWALYRVSSAKEAAAGALVLLLFVVPVALLFVPDMLWGGIRSLSMRYLTPAWLGVMLALGWVGAETSSSWRARLVRTAVVGAALASCILNAQRTVTWNKSTSVSLSEVGALVNRTQGALVVGNLERHSPGNLAALSVRLRPGTKMQFLDAAQEERWSIPAGFSAIYLFNPIPPYREAMERREGVKTLRLLADDFTELWQVELPGPAPRQGASGPF